MTVHQEDVDFLAHFGVKGMKWGVRNDRPAGVSGSTNRMAKKDAKEHATAKLYYGEGAGTRRKLIKATVEQRSKNDPNYKKAFDHHLANQDMANRAGAATKERNRTDRKDRTKKRAGYLARRATGEMGTQAAFTAVGVAGVAFLKSERGQQAMKKTVSTIKNSKQSRQYVKNINDVLRNSGLI